MDFTSRGLFYLLKFYRGRKQSLRGIKKIFRGGFFAFDMQKSYNYPKEAFSIESNRNEQILKDFHAALIKLSNNRELTEVDRSVFHFVVHKVHGHREMGVPDDWIKSQLEIEDRQDVYDFILYSIEQCKKEGIFR